MWQVIHGDCLEVLPTLGKVDAVVTDPPYGVVSRESSGLRSLDKGAADVADFDIATVADALDRVADASLYVWCSREQMSEWSRAFVDRGMTTRTGVWIKSNPSPMNGERFWLSSVELCVFARKPLAPFFARCASPDWRGPTEQIDGHPTPKPVWLMRKLIRASCAPGSTILDPFCGSGSTGVAALQEGMNFIGIEKEAKYVEIARRRIGAEAAQGKLGFA